MKLEDTLKQLISLYGKDKVKTALQAMITSDYPVTNASKYVCSRLGVDLSHWNPHFNGADAANVGIEFAIIRAGYGKGHIDKCAERHYRQCQDNGIETGFYWFSYAETPQEAIGEANHILHYVRDKRVSYPIVFDYEYESRAQNKELSLEAINSIAYSFLKTIEDAGYYAMFYANKDFYDNVWNTEIKKKFDCWYARYKDDGYKDILNCNLWQYSNQYKMNSHNYDGDMCFLDYPRLLKDRGLNNL